ncbi:MAG: glycoside hydrolase family 3 N-terminal domain-containing protein [Crocinitomicaceae bacterium]|nr:glycoside hydrolase family 3 N-terminal domain-containing protein [Crocinitomicaceae bacterium]
MRLLFISIISSLINISAIAQDARGTMADSSDYTFTLDDFLTPNKLLKIKVDSVFNTLDQSSIIAQLIMPATGRMGQPIDSINYYIKHKMVGGVLMLNGTKAQFTSMIKNFEEANTENGNLPFLYSADAEPSLVNRKITGTKIVAKANAIKTLEEVTEVAESISNDLNDIGINYNFSPVVDLASNSTVGYRGFGSNPANVIPFSNAFIQQTQMQNIIATAKHFPGHGLVTGDTHKSLQVIDGEMRELKYYPPLIEEGVLSIMIAHIAVKNNRQFDTNGFPATTSEVIVTDLLRDSLGFNGLIVTDAMNMGGVVKIPNASVKAIAAGCDILLMPKSVNKAHKELTAEYLINSEFREKVHIAAKRVIRIKICLGLI